MKKQSDNITVDDFLLDSLEQHIITEPIEYQQGRYDELESYIKSLLILNLIWTTMSFEKII